MCKRITENLIAVASVRRKCLHVPPLIGLLMWYGLNKELNRRNLYDFRWWYLLISFLAVWLYVHASLRVEFRIWFGGFSLLSREHECTGPSYLAVTKNSFFACRDLCRDNYEGCQRVSLTILPSHRVSTEYTKHSSRFEKAKFASSPLRPAHVVQSITCPCPIWYLNDIEVPCMSSSS
jgi:hypothetical protein